MKLSKAGMQSIARFCFAFAVIPVLTSCSSSGLGEKTEEQKKEDYSKFRSARICSDEKLKIFSLNTSESAPVVADAAFQACERLWSVYSEALNGGSYDIRETNLIVRNGYTRSAITRVLEVRSNR